MKKRILLLCLALLIIVSALCVTVSAATDGQEYDLKFMGASLVMDNSVNIRYVADLDGIANPSGAKVLVWNEPQDSYVKGTENFTVSYDGITQVKDGVTYYCFDFEGVSAKRIADDFYAVVYASTASGEFYSAPCKYSALQYAYTKLGKLDKTATTNTELIAMLNAMLEYGATAQLHFDYNESSLANAEHYQITVSGGALSDGFTSGLYASGETVTITAPSESDGLVFSHWQLSNGSHYSTETTITPTVTAKETYTAVYQSSSETEKPAVTMPAFDLNSIPEYSQIDQIGYVYLNNKTPFFTSNQIVDESYTYYAPLDSLGRPVMAVACLGVEFLGRDTSDNLPDPPGWHSTASELNGFSLYNRSHLIADSLAGCDDKENLITGTQKFNQIYMQMFESQVLDMMREYQSSSPECHILYRVTPIYVGNELVPRGVIMEGYSVEDNGNDICFCAYIYNNQPGYVIDYATGDYSVYTSEDSGEGGDTGDSGNTGDGDNTGDSGNTGGEVTGTTHTADFASFDDDGTVTSYMNRENDDGWTVTNSRSDEQSAFGTDPQITLNGKKSAIGALTSCALSGGIKSLSVNYGYAFQENKGVSLTVNIKDTSGNVLATTQIVNTTLAQNTAASFTWTLDEAIEGSFIIEIVNNCPSNSTSNKDRVSLWNLTWVSA